MCTIDVIPLSIKVHDNLNSLFEAEHIHVLGKGVTVACMRDRSRNLITSTDPALFGSSSLRTCVLFWSAMRFAARFSRRPTHCWNRFGATSLHESPCSGNARFGNWAVRNFVQ